MTSGDSLTGTLNSAALGISDTSGTGSKTTATVNTVVSLLDIDETDLFITDNISNSSAKIGSISINISTID
ncbi:MAG: hypothetical protein Q4B60_09550 [Erysipelotrichaceae bacterium]|nr:hypothetical protein [Erysipelotrichaceae bacterium]